MERSILNKVFITVLLVEHRCILLSRNSTVVAVGLLSMRVFLVLSKRYLMQMGEEWKYYAITVILTLDMSLRVKDSPLLPMKDTVSMVSV